ncbi:MAG: penicillin-binding protein activator LpoB [Treponema sp.]|nr:penicillin-binding protein activator LpoB [Treponema sp.]
MKKILLALVCVLGLAGCMSTGDGSAKVTRLDADTQTDLSGYWNDTDVRIVTDSLVSECVNSPAVTAFNQVKKRTPIVIVGSFRNQSDEHIDTSILAKKFESSLINSGKVDFVASASERGEVRDERNDQQVNSSEETAKSLRNETGADFMLIGSVKTIIDSSGKQTTRTYYVNAELIDIETNRKLWVGDNSSIKKLIKQSNYRP